MSIQIKSARAKATFPAANRAMTASSVGDPGLFGFIGKGLSALGGIASKIPGVGGVAGTVLGTAGGLLAGKSTSKPGVGMLNPKVPAGYIVDTRTTTGSRCRSGAIRIGNTCVMPGDIFPGGAPFTTPAGPAAGMALACPSGYHPNKSGYFLKSGEYVPPGSRCVKNRRRNPLNPRALDRAISRIESGKRASKKLSRVTVRKKTCTSCR